MNGPQIRWGVLIPGLSWSICVCGCSTVCARGCVCVRERDRKRESEQEKAGESETKNDSLYITRHFLSCSQQEIILRWDYISCSTNELSAHTGFQSMLSISIGWWTNDLSVSSQNSRQIEIMDLHVETLLALPEYVGIQPRKVSLYIHSICLMYSQMLIPSGISMRT